MNEEQTMQAEVTFESLKDKVHEQFLELQELRKSYDELTKSALKLDEIIKEKQEEIDQLKAREEEHQRLNGELREENKELQDRFNSLIEAHKICDEENYSLSQENSFLKYHIGEKDKEEEIERLNNIINELEKWIKDNDLGKYRTENVVNTDELLDKLQELKGEDKE